MSFPLHEPHPEIPIEPVAGPRPLHGRRAVLQWDALLRQIANALPAMIWMCGADGRATLFNKRWLQFTGCALRDALEGGWATGVHPDDVERRRAVHAAALLSHTPFEAEYRLRRADGEYRWMLDQGAPQRGARADFHGYVVVAVDITDSKRVETALRASEQRLRIAAESAGISVYELDLATGKGEVNSADPFLGSLKTLQDWARAIHPDDRERILGAAERRKKGFREEYRLVDPDGTVRHYLDYGAPERDGRWIGAWRDITRSKEAEAALARLAAIVQCSRDAIISSDTEGLIQTWNPAAEKLYGYTAAEMVGRPLVTLYPPGQHEAAGARLAEVLRGETVWTYETEHMRRRGSVFPVSVVASPIKDAEGRVVGNSGIARDITEPRRAQQALMESENRFRALVQNSSDTVTLLDPDGVILYDSPGVAELLGVSPEQRLGRPVLQWIHADDISYVRMLREELLRAPGARLRAQVRVRHADGSWRWCDSWAMNLIAEPGVGALVISSRDITALKGVETALRESEERYRKLIEDASDVIFTIDLDGNFTSVNAIGERISGYSRQELLSMNLQQLAAAEFMAPVRSNLAALLKGAAPPSLEAEILTREGRRVAIEVSGRLQFRNALPAEILCIARDISERKRLELLERNRQEVLEMVAQNQPLEAVLRRVEETLERYYPGAVARILLADASASPPGAKRDAAHADHLGHLTVPIRACGGEILGRLEISRPEPWQATESEQILLDSKAKLASIALEHRQITDRLAYQAQHDPLTGLPNRTLLEDRLRQALTLARRQAKSVAVLYVDLDRFKFINDTLGHHIGDLLLQQVAGRLKGAVRESDTLARPGGDEFVAVLSGIETVHDAEVAGERIMEAMSDPFQVKAHELFASVSVGLSLFPEDGEDAATLQKHADVAMYEAKNGGRNRFQRFAREMNAASSERLEIENQLHRALERGELQLYYQPQFQLASRQLAGLEALLRWNHPKWGLMLPARFVPVAEESGLIVPISLWVLREACRQHQLWRRAGYPPVKIAVNISATQFRRSNLAKTVAEVLAEREMESRYLEVELTEGVLMRDAADSARQIAELRALGVRIAIDDFGTGYSSLSYLQRLPIDNLKIDKCFVQGIDREAGTRPLVQAIVGLAHGLNLTATAEGVETENELAVLRTLGCDEVQGFLLGRPVPADRWEAYWSPDG